MNRNRKGAHRPGRAARAGDTARLLSMLTTPQTPAGAEPSRVSGRDGASCRRRPRRATRIVTTVAAALAIAAGGAWVGAEANGWQVDALPGDDVKVSGCVIRFSDPDGAPSIYANGAHLAAGCADVDINPANGRLRVTQTVTDPAENPVIFAVAQTDETLGGRGITCGASGGTDDTEYVCFDARLGRALDLSDPGDLLRMQGRYSNLWLGFFHAPGAGR